MEIKIFEMKCQNRKKQSDINNVRESKLNFKGEIFMSMMSKSVNSGVMSAGIKTVSSVVDVCNGKKTVGEAAGDVAVAGVKGAATAVATAEVAGAVGAMTAGTVLAGTAVAALAPVAIVYGVGKLLGELFD